MTETPPPTKRKVETQEFDQILLPGLPPCPVKRIIIKENEISTKKFQAFSRTADPIGLSVGYDAKGLLETLAFTNGKACAIIKIDTRNKDALNKRPDRMAILEQHVFCRDAGEVFAFDMDIAAVSLCDALNLRILRAVDIQSAYQDNISRDRLPLDCIKACVGTNLRIAENNIKTVFSESYRDPKVDIEKTFSSLTQRAWAAHFVASYQNADATFSEVKRINTKNFSSQMLKVIIRMLESTRRVNELGPNSAKHQFLNHQAADHESVAMQQKTFSNRLRLGQSVRVVQQTPVDGKITRSATVTVTSGKVATFSFGDGGTATSDDKTLVSVTSMDRASVTNADIRTRTEIRRVLQGDLELFADNVWVRNILTAKTVEEFLPWPAAWHYPISSIDQLHLEHNPARRHLNPSQQHSLDDMLSTVKPITLIQGPPGTGKTSVIAAFVQTALSLGYSGIWLIAQSNVAVKNIAEKLIKVGFNDWKLLVSQDFKYDWHDHLYTEISQNIIISTDFKTLPNNHLTGVKVILCTLSMLSNQFIFRFTRAVSLNILVVDEASQIKTAEYINVFTSFETLRKMCFIGDPKQLPPHGADDVEQVQSIFEVPHLQDQCLLLNTQYRMPPQLGSFISNRVYDDKLYSWSDHPVPPDTPSIFFVDVVDGREGMTPAKSFENLSEADIAVKLALGLDGKGIQYRIITPYDGQRNLIETRMKDAEMNWENKCFNVDSFQGNEEDIIIISTVRSRAIGFLQSLRRTNVMLTRCKKGMYILSSKSFLNGNGRDSLVGDLAQEMGDKAWLTVKDVEDEKIGLV